MPTPTYRTKAKTPGSPEVRACDGCHWKEDASYWHTALAEQHPDWSHARLFARATVMAIKAPRHQEQHT